ncbi:hypothetical protein [Burkholderia ambifaria]|uniref:hypothetical protein n=1 Tax=Burkholderia ambifaria TaxID=152480 RepID=UPI00158CB99C|nr:hypothetical protein [Burkholderia ambifaria]
MKTYVVDMNVLQSPDLVNSLQRDSATEYVIPDVALVEMCKHEEWRLTMELALSVFQGHTERVHVAISVGEALNNELKTGKLTEQDGLLSRGFTEFGRQLIKDLASGSIEGDLEKKFDEARGNLLSAELNAPDAKARTEQYLALLKKGLHEDIAKVIRSGKVGRERFVAFAYIAARTFVGRMLQKDFSMSDGDAELFIEKNPLVLRYQFLVVRHCLLTVQAGGNIAAMKPEKELNHQLDFDYALIASYFDGLLSNDKRANEAYQDLMTVIGTSSVELTNRVSDWFKELERVK